MTPDTQLVKTELFDDIPVRIVDVNGIPMIPVADIVSALGYDRGNISRLMKRNTDLFSPYKGVVNLTTPGGQQEMTCLNETGIVGLLIKMDYTRVKDKGFRKKVLKFQQWSFDKLTKVIHGEIQTKLPVEDPVMILNHELDIADSIIKRTGMDKAQAHAYAIVLAGDKAKMDLQCYATFIKAQAQKEQNQQLLLPEALPEDKVDYDKYFSLTQISGFLKLPTDKVRNVLESINLIYFDNGIWHLTKQGEKYGKVFMVTPGYPYRMNQKAYIKYNPLALDILKKYFDVEVPVTKVKE